MFSILPTRTWPEGFIEVEGGKLVTVPKRVLVTKTDWPTDLDQ
jgi:hypothetical protein